MIEALIKLLVFPGYIKSVNEINYLIVFNYSNSEC